MLLFFTACSRTPRATAPVEAPDSGKALPVTAAAPPPPPAQPASDVPAAPVLHPPQNPEQLEAAYDAAWKTLSKRPADAAAQDAFERAWLDWEFQLLGEEWKERTEDAPPLRLEGCAPGASARDCIGARIGRRFDSSWYRVEVRGDAVLLLLFHARDPDDEDAKKDGNLLVVFRGTLQTPPGAPPRLTVLSRNEEKVPDTLGAVLARHATPADPKDPTTRWGLRFEPLSPEEFALVDALPDEWAALHLSDGRYWRLDESPSFFIVKEPALRMAWLSFSERDGRLVPLLRASKEGSTWRLGGYELRWQAQTSDMAMLTADNPNAEARPYLPVRQAERFKVYRWKPTPEEEREENEKAGTFKTDEGVPVPWMVGKVAARCVRGSVSQLKSGVYEVRCSCGTNCGASTYVDTNSKRTSSMHSLPLAVDPERLFIAISTDGQMPLRVVGLFDEKEWLRLRRPTEETWDISTVVEASFTGSQLHLKYLHRNGEFIEEDVDLPARPVEATSAHE